MMNVIMLNGAIYTSMPSVIMLNVITFNVVMLSVVEPIFIHSWDSNTYDLVIGI
jgi:hypothetical protein